MVIEEKSWIFIVWDQNPETPRMVIEEQVDFFLQELKRLRQSCSMKSGGGSKKTMYLLLSEKGLTTTTRKHCKGRSMCSTVVVFFLIPKLGDQLL